MRIRTGTLAAGVLAMLLAGTAQAALVSRLGGLAVYDTDLDVTWLVNANLAQTNTFGVTGILGDGRMTWDKANEWVAAMNTANHLGYGDWRLPHVVDTGAPGCDWAYSGTDCGFSMDLSTSEMAHLYYSELGNAPYFDASGNETGCPGEPNYCLTNTGPFVNLQADYYWSGTVYAPDTDRAWWFHFLTGRQESVYRDWGLYAWAVRSGDSAVAAPVVPVPAAAWLLGSALGVLGFVRRRK